MNFSKMRRNCLRKNSSLLSSIKSPFFIKGTLKKKHGWKRMPKKKAEGLIMEEKRSVRERVREFLWYILKRKERGSEAKRSTFENLKRSSPEAMVW